MSRAYLTCDPHTDGVPFDQWQTFCAEHAITHNPLTVGGNVYRVGQIVVTYETRALDFCGGSGISGISEVARLALSAWCKWGGKISADPEVRRSMAAKPDRTICVEPRLDDFHACLSDDRRIWGCGSTMSVVIGDLVRTHSAALGLQIDSQTTESPHDNA